MDRTKLALVVQFRQISDVYAHILQQ